MESNSVPVTPVRAASALDPVERFIYGHPFMEKVGGHYTESEHQQFIQDVLDRAGTLCRKPKVARRLMSDAWRYVLNYKVDLFDRTIKKDYSPRALGHMAILTRLPEYGEPMTDVMPTFVETPNGTEKLGPPKPPPKKSPYFAAPKHSKTLLKKRQAGLDNQQGLEEESGQRRESKRLKEKDCKKGNSVRCASKEGDLLRASADITDTPASNVDLSGVEQNEISNVQASRRGAKQARGPRKGITRTSGVDTSPEDSLNTSNPDGHGKESAIIQARKPRGKGRHSPDAKPDDSQADSHDIQVPSKLRKSGKGSRAKANPKTAQGFR